MKNQSKAYFYTSIAVLFWATVSSVFKLSLRYMSPYQLLLYSCLSSIIVLLFFVIKTGKLKELFSKTWKEYLIIFIMGLLNPYLYFIFLFKAYELLPAQEAQPITYTWPIIMIFLSVPILKQKVTKYDIASLFICYLGICIISTKGELLNLQISNLTGLIYAVLSTFIWALYWIVNTKIKIDPIVTLFLNFLFSFPFVLITCYFYSSIIANPYGIIGALYVGVFEMGLAFILWLYALKLADKKNGIINLTYLSPVLALFFIQFLTGEKIIFPTVVGLAVILLGLLVQKKR